MMSLDRNVPRSSKNTQTAEQRWNRRIAALLTAFFLSLSGGCFIRTDQLDGETDWKLKVAVGCTQRLPAVGVRYDSMVTN